MPEPDAKVLSRRAEIIEGLGELVPPDSLITEESALRDYECDALTARSPPMTRPWPEARNRKKR
jgi:glycolate oxidase